MDLSKKPKPLSAAETDKFIRDFEAKADERTAWLNALAKRVAHLPLAEREAALDKLIEEAAPKFKPSSSA